jgi:solute carrier family 25 phosphate transporter 23/24/25/41
LQVPEIEMADRMIAGGLAGFVSQSVIYPLETIKIRMMAELSSSFAGNVRRPGTVSAVVVASQMWRAEGFRSFFRGIGPSLIG